MRRLLVVLAALACLGAASDPAERLPDPAQESRARAIFREVRCMVCQNESIDDSDADLARDLRQVVREQVVRGVGDDEIKRFLVGRYGEFILLRPSLSPGNAILWGAPFLVAIAGLALWFGRVRARTPESELSADEDARLERLAGSSLDDNNASNTGR